MVCFGQNFVYSKLYKLFLFRHLCPQLQIFCLILVQREEQFQELTRPPRMRKIRPLIEMRCLPGMLRPSHIGKSCLALVCCPFSWSHSTA